VRMLELELTGTCNLSCPLCVRSNPDFEKFVSKNIRPLGDIIEQLDLFPNITNMCLAGIISEPTHYDDLIPLVLYLESRNIEVELYVNGNTHDEEWWFNLGKTLKCTEVIFTVCGSTQAVHGTYRVGSDLGEIYRHAEAFRRSGNCNDTIQVIKFNYNEHDLDDNHDYIVRGFNKVRSINSLPYQERFGINCDIKMTGRLSEIYSRIHRSTLDRFKSSKVKCKSLETRFISIDQFGNEYPCFLYKLYTDDVFDYDYTKIRDNEHSFCFECEKMATVMLELNGMERMA